MPSLRKAILDPIGVAEETAKKQAEVKDKKSRKKREVTSVFETLPYDERLNYSELLKVIPSGHGKTSFQRVDALFGYFATGNLREAARMAKINENTVLGWAQQQWWKEGIQKIKEAKDEEMDRLYTQALDKSIVGVLDRIENGEEHVTKDGDVVLKQVGGKDMMLINAMLYDKRNLLRNNGKLVVEHKITTDERLQILADQFRKISRSKTIDGEIVVEDQSMDKDTE